MFTNMRVRLVAAIGVVLLVALGGTYRYITGGGLIARQPPNRIEAAAARWVLDLSIPSASKATKNPIAVTDASLTAGRTLYQQKCEVCHGYDGAGSTDTGGGQYPPPLDLRSAIVTARTDGELFYFIRNGIRNTAMPGWQMPDNTIWHLVTFIRALPRTSPRVSTSASTPAGQIVAAQYAGSAACQSCHRDYYERWSKTLMANVVRDPRQHPDAILPDLTKPDPLITFTKDDIAFVYGSKWKQRYFTRVGDDYYPLPVQWDIGNKTWRPYHIADTGADWWTSHYPSSNMERPTGPTCDGCHSVNYDIRTKKPSEWNVGCETCHGPGSVHAAQPSRANIFSPSQADAIASTDTCIQCHSKGSHPPDIMGLHQDGFGSGLLKRLIR
jgi:mono/diheme cytochrome c family protein